MDRRYAAQREIAHVERRRTGWTEQSRFIGDVGNDADTVPNVQRARLFRDVGRREMLVQETAERRIAVLGQDDPGVIVEKAVQHHPVEPGQLAKRPGGAFAQFA